MEAVASGEKGILAEPSTLWRESEAPRSLVICLRKECRGHSQRTMCQLTLIAMSAICLLRQVGNACVVVREAPTWR